MNQSPVMNPPPSVLRNSLRQKPEPGPRIETAHRRIVTDLPAPGSLETLRNTDRTISYRQLLSAPNRLGARRRLPSLRRTRELLD